MIREKNLRTSSLEHIQNVVLSQLQNNVRYIQERKTTDPIFSDFKYFVDKGVYTHLSEETLKSEIDSTYNTIQSSTVSKTLNDVIGQTFYIDKENYPNGLFLDAIDLYFSSKDTLSPVIVEIVPTVNGYPSSENVIPFSRVIKYPEDIQVSSSTTTLPDPTIFRFKNPVYLQPGVYAFVIRTNSKNYTLFVSERGKVSITDNTLVVNPYIGDFFQSQQGTTWIADPTKDCCFRLRRCVFATGTKSYTFFTNNSDEAFDGVNFRPHFQDFGDTTDITFNFVSNDIDIDGAPSTYTDKLEPNKNIFFDSVRTLETSSTGANVDVTLFTTSDHVSPVLDIDATTLVLLNNEISQYSSNVANTELTPYGGISSAKYVTKQVTLQEGFDSTALTVYVDVNRPAGTDIEVYCKIQNNYDYSSSFEEHNWIKIPKLDTSNQGIIYSPDENSYTEEVYQDLNLSYTANTGSSDVTFTEFRHFAVKVVFYSDNTISVPKIKNLRVVSTL